MDKEDFSDAPVTITELAAQRQMKKDGGGAAQWTARDTLVSLLREIDSGSLPMPNTIVICFGIDTDAGGWETGYRVASPHYGMTLGLLSATMMDLGKS